MATTYDLELLEDLIIVTLDPKTLLQQQATVTQILEWESLAATESIRIKKRMKTVIGQPGKEKYKERYVQRNQQDIIMLKNKIVNYLLPKSIKDINLKENEPPLVRLYKLLFNALKGLLEYIEEFFKQYFNLDERIPESYLMRSQYFLKLRLKSFEKRFAKTPIDPQLLQVAFTHIEKICTPGKRPVTYRNFLYLKRLLKEFEDIAPKNDVANEQYSDLKIIELLVYLNFNYSPFITYLINSCVNNINALPEQASRTERLAQYYQEFNQMQVKPGVAFKVNGYGVKQQITTWISEELHYLEQKQRLLSVVPLLQNDAELKEEDKLHFSASVEVLSLLARSAKDSKLILNKQSTNMYRNLARFCRTMHTENLSANSLLKKGYVAERNAKQTALNILHEMIKQIHKY